MEKAAILAAGEGSRLKQISPYKPIVKIYGNALLEIVIKNLQMKNFKEVQIIFNDDEINMDLKVLPSLKYKNIKYFYKSTSSSMHSLNEVIKKIHLKKNEHLFVSMVDSIVLPKDITNFFHFCKSIKSNESAIIATGYIDDENPLTLKLDNDNYVSEFQCGVEDNVYITSGVYYFSGEIIPILSDSINSGQTKMRNFLTDLISQNHKIKVFLIDKTIDIDRPCDIKEAENFLRGQSC
jgi:NDP-sugar pyrophosphorylase family protein